MSVVPSTPRAYCNKARNCLYDLQTALDDLSGIPAPSALSIDEAKKLRRAIPEARGSIDQLLWTIEILERTGLDVVDLQGRMVKETKKLVNPLKRIDGLASKGIGQSEKLKLRLLELEEKAQLAAGGLFPSSVRGLDGVNDLILFKLRPLVLPRFQREVERQKQKGKWSGARRRVVQAASAKVEANFAALNGFLNQLGTQQVDMDTLRDGVRSHRVAMKELAEQARVQKKDKAFSGFGSLLDEVRGIALEARRRLLEIEVPLFPAWEDLGSLRRLIAKDLYQGLAGAQKFALLNILARMQAVEVGAVDLLDPGFAITIWLVFPDRIYFKARGDLIRTVRGQKSKFETAPAGLHRFNKGSYKQKKPVKGGLQLSFAPKVDAGTKHVNVDADIDLFKRPFSHLFGEVLVNHLTGNTTSQYRVHEILKKQEVAPIGGFEVVHTSSLA